MTPFFVRLKLAFKTFFSILFRNHIPAEVAEVFRPAPAAPAPQEPTAASVTQGDSSAAQLLAVLQRDGRLIDFLMEDVITYADAQIGAAVRNVHAGCRQALQKYVRVGAGAARCRRKPRHRRRRHRCRDGEIDRECHRPAAFQRRTASSGVAGEPHGAAPAACRQARPRPGRSRSVVAGPP